MIPKREYPEYATCTWCGFKKYCRFENRKFICMACDTTHPQGVDREPRV